MQLHPSALPGLPDSVQRPLFDRTRLEPGIVHLGIGAFARAHLLPSTDAAIANTGDGRWGVVGVSLRQADTHDALQAQHGLYTLALRDAQGSRLQVVGSLLQVLVAPHDPAAVLRRMAAPATRIVSLTVTEKGYCLAGAGAGADAGLNLDHADIVYDRAHPLPRSAPGFIVRALQARRAAGQGGLTLLSCDNLPSNGNALRQAVLALAAAVEPGLDAWAAAHCSFPNSMVDRIVPRTTDADRVQIGAALGVHDAWPVLGEPFIDWVIEDHFVAGRPDWAFAGARFVADAQPYEQLKLRLVNGSHSALAYLGALAGLQTVDEALAQPALRVFVDTLMQHEVEPTLPALPGLDLAAYRGRLLQRFANPALQHRLLQIAMDGSQKVPQRWLASVRDRLERGQSIERLALSVAAWTQFLGGQDEQGRALPLDDPRADDLKHAAGQEQGVLGFEPVFGDLRHQAAFITAVQRQQQALKTLGALHAAAAVATATDAGDQA